MNAVKALAKESVEVVLIDRSNHHTFQPLLYQVALGVLSDSDIAQPLRTILRDVPNVRIVMDEVVGIDPDLRCIQLESGNSINFDYLILASGATHSYFGNDTWERNAPGLKTIEHALEIRRRIMLAFEEAERNTLDGRKPEQINFVVIGGGPTGIELAGAIRDISKYVLKDDFHSIDPTSCKVMLLEGSPRILANYPEELSRKAELQLRQLGVEVHTNTQVTNIDDLSVWIGTTRIPAAVTLWAAGVQPSPLGRFFPGSLDRKGAIEIDGFLNPKDYRNVFVCGDLAHLEQDGKRVPGVAQPAIQMGRHAAISIVADLAGRPRAPFRYFDKGDMATIGRYLAVADIRWPIKARISGFPAWFAWLFVHLMFLVGLKKRATVFVSWGWTLLFRTLGAGLITDFRCGASAGSSSDAHHEPLSLNSASRRPR